MSYTIKENEPLSHHTVFNIGGPARFFAELSSAEDLALVVKASRRSGLPWVMLGAGSNVLVSDRGFNGVVIRWQGGEVRVDGRDVIADAPVAMARVVRASLAGGLRGFEWAIGIPGTIGGSVRGNAGCFGREIKDVVKTVLVFNAAAENSESWTHDRAEFKYRDSVFKRRPELVITSVVISLEPGDAKAGEELVRQYSMHRSKTQDIGSHSAGCIFKNVPWASIAAGRDTFLGRFPELAKFSDLPAIPAGFLVERVGLKGCILGRAKVSERHGNFFLNTGGATAGEIRALVGIAKNLVHEAYGLTLEEEIQYLGFE
ncbi:MAG: UDP-N-acetylmuramate dehydrogenase [Candidatus Sungbacteria bacterium]|nr:UDP-N-acetylmuramate dehydrogenase [Candidatus Sungbacteria bacterium]